MPMEQEISQAAGNKEERNMTRFIDFFLNGEKYLTTLIISFHESLQDAAPKWNSQRALRLRSVALLGLSNELGMAYKQTEHVHCGRPVLRAEGTRVNE